MFNTANIIVIIVSMLMIAFSSKHSRGYELLKLFKTLRS